MKFYVDVVDAYTGSTEIKRHELEMDLDLVFSDVWEVVKALYAQHPFVSPEPVGSHQDQKNVYVKWLDMQRVVMKHSFLLVGIYDGNLGYYGKKHRAYLPYLENSKEVRVFQELGLIPK